MKDNTITIVYGIKSAREGDWNELFRDTGAISVPRVGDYLEFECEVTYRVDQVIYDHLAAHAECSLRVVVVFMHPESWVIKKG